MNRPISFSMCSCCTVLMDIQNETCMFFDMAFHLRGAEARKRDFLFQCVPGGALGGQWPRRFGGIPA